MKCAARLQGGDIGIAVIVKRVQMDRGRHHPALLESRESRLAAFRQGRKAGAALSQSPFQQWIVAAADDRRWRRGIKPVRPRQAGAQPTIEFLLRE
jgi:hypothetical protein